MTIEQARQQIKAHRIPIEDLLDELEWYRKQDLIDPSDLIRSIGINYGCDECKADCVDELGDCICEIQQFKERVIKAIASIRRMKENEQAR